MNVVANPPGAARTMAWAMDSGGKGTEGKAVWTSAAATVAADDPASPTAAHRRGDTPGPGSASRLTS